MNHLLDREPILGGELEVPLIVRRNAHDGARAVVRQDVIGHPDGRALAVIGIDGEMPRRHAMLLNRAQVARLARLLLLLNQLVHLHLECGVCSGESSHQRMLRRKLHARRPKNRIHSRSEHTNTGLF